VKRGGKTRNPKCAHIAIKGIEKTAADANAPQSTVQTCVPNTVDAHRRSVQKAQRRLAEATDTMARALLKMAVNDNVSDSVKLTAIRDALDRGGMVAKTAVEVGVSVKPFEAILDRLESGSRAEFRGSRGIEDAEGPQQTALPLCVR
jgi:hypothetical protein